MFPSNVVVVVFAPISVRNQLLVRPPVRVAARHSFGLSAAGSIDPIGLSDLPLRTNASALRPPSIGSVQTRGSRPKRYDGLAGIELAAGSWRLLLAWESGSLVARLELNAADRPLGTRGAASRRSCVSSRRGCGAHSSAIASGHDQSVDASTTTVANARRWRARDVASWAKGGPAQVAIILGTPL
jgi:hypothetical protein